MKLDFILRLIALHYFKTFSYMQIAHHPVISPNREMIWNIT